MLQNEPYMVKCHEDAYWLNNLSHFAFNIEGYCAPSVIIYIFGVFITILFITQCPKNCPNFDRFFFNVCSSEGALIYEALIFQTLKKKGQNFDNFWDTL